MLDLPELDDKVCLYLNWNDLARCARVSKKWHSIVIPHLWRDLSWPWSTSGIQKRSFCAMALEDYLSNQQYQGLLGQGSDTEQTLPSPHFSTTLSKYGHLIRVLPGPTKFLDSFQAIYPPGQGKNQEAQEVFLHLTRHCSSDVRVPIIRLFNKNLSPAPNTAMKAILDFSLPRLVHMFIFATVLADGQGISGLMNLLERCSTTLEKLELGIVISNSRMKYVQENQTEDEPKVWISLKELILIRCDDGSDVKAFWPWLLKKCSRVEKLAIHHRTELVEILVQGMLAHMPNLTEIDLAHGFTRTPDDRMSHGEIMTLFTGSRKGWRAVKLRYRLVFGKAVMDAVLTPHFSTLEVLDLSGCDDLSGNDVIQILRSCTKLHTFLNTQISSGRRTGRFKIDAKAFIDSDSDKGSLKPWSCETTLKNLRVHIIGIPRPYMGHNGAVEEACPYGRRGIQGQVYDRLARLTNLEILWLGDDVNGKEPGCLEMSPESGLVKLSGLKKLSEIGLPGTIEVRGIQWMAENWPRLRAIRGLCRVKARRWLRENYPDIVASKWRWQI